MHGFEEQVVAIDDVNEIVMVRLGAEGGRRQMGPCGFLQGHFRFTDAKSSRVMMQCAMHTFV